MVSDISSSPLIRLLDIGFPSNNANGEGKQETTACKAQRLREGDTVPQLCSNWGNGVANVGIR